MNESIVLIGAGSAMFTRGLLTDLVLSGWECQLSLVDTDPDALQVAESLARKIISGRKAPIRLSASTDLRQVLSGATVIICTIGVGGRRAWEQDVFIPRRHGIFQPVGDSVMPGGTSRALRMIPAMVDIAREIQDLAPSALFFNYSNPMGPICRGVRKATGAPIIGLCHGVNHTAAYLEDVLELKRGSMEYNAVGMNHLTWFIQASTDARDLMPELKMIAARKKSERDPEEKSEEKTSNRADPEQPFSWELMDLFGAFPAVLDRHITEFFPGLFSREKSYFGKTLGVDAFSFEDTIAWGDSLFDQMRELVSLRTELPDEFYVRVPGEQEQVLDIVHAIRSNSGQIYSANLPNEGIIANLPSSSIVECPVAALDGTLRPIDQPRLPSGIAGTLSTRMHWMETVVDSALEGDYRKLVQALVLDGSVESVEGAERLAGDLIEAHREHLPQFRLPE